MQILCMSMASILESVVARSFYLWARKRSTFVSDAAEVAGDAQSVSARPKRADADSFGPDGRAKCSDVGTLVPWRQAKKCRGPLFLSQRPSKKRSRPTDRASTTEQKDPTPRRSSLRAEAKRPEVRPSRADARAKGVVAGTPRLAAKAHGAAGNPPSARRRGRTQRLRYGINQRGEGMTDARGALPERRLPGASGPGREFRNCRPHSHLGPSLGVRSALASGLGVSDADFASQHHVRRAGPGQRRGDCPWRCIERRGVSQRQEARGLSLPPWRRIATTARAELRAGLKSRQFA